MTSAPSLAALGPLALFLDFDGTLVEIADHPDGVTIGPPTLEVLGTLCDKLGGALAIVTGREIAVIDRHLAPLRLPVAGVHGLTRRNAGGIVSAVSSGDFVTTAARRLGAFVERHDGLLLEPKGVTLALHYRARPELEAACIAAFEDVISNMPGIELKRGKMVLEAKPNIANKGSAVLDFLEEAPFQGRTPCFAGDDVTDEDAFVVVNRLGGISIKVGDGETVANYRAENTSAFLAWLRAAAIEL
ncbi:MAG: trehalose-phosphatase [Hyphomicrobiaceae bacterium]|nr:trehalose-phosphatase [Hyphomicrobiaceae bacterium]